MPLLILLFIVVPLVELYVIVQVGQAIGVLPTIAILFADSVIGAVLLRSQGRAAWRRFNEAVELGRVPAREVMDGVMVIFGGAFLLTPGFITDIVGILLLLPPTRAVIRRVGARLLRGRLATGAAVWGFERARGPRRAPQQPGWGPPPGGPGQGRGSATGARPGDIEGTAREVDEQDQPLPPGERPPGERPPGPDPER